MASLPYGSMYTSIPKQGPTSPFGLGADFSQTLDSMVEPPDFLKSAQAGALNAETNYKYGPWGLGGGRQQVLDAQENATFKMQQQKWDMVRNLFGGLGNGSFGLGFNMNSNPASIPAPAYIHAAPVWSQNQINSQANLQRNNLLTQANNSSRDFSQQMASRGFSPFSPFAMMNQQNNLMRANAGAAANETNLNFNSAQANSDAMLKAQGINAGLYGDYTRNLLGSQQSNLDYQLRSRGQQQDFIGMLLRSLAA